MWKLLVFVQGKSFSAGESNGPLTLAAITSATGLSTSQAAVKDRRQNDKATLPKGMGTRRSDSLSLSLSFQTLSKGGKGSLSGPQQYVAVQRPALPLQEGRMQYNIPKVYIKKKNSQLRLLGNKLNLHCLIICEYL